VYVVLCLEVGATIDKTLIYVIFNDINLMLPVGKSKGSQFQKD